MHLWRVLLHVALLPARACAGTPWLEQAVTNAMVEACFGALPSQSVLNMRMNAFSTQVPAGSWAWVDATGIYSNATFCNQAENSSHSLCFALL